MPRNSTMHLSSLQTKLSLANSGIQSTLYSTASLPASCLQQYLQLLWQTDSHPSSLIKSPIYTRISQQALQLYLHTSNRLPLHLNSLLFDTCRRTRSSSYSAKHQISNVP